MKILFFVPQGKVLPKHTDYQYEQNKVSNKVIFGNGSFNHGFEDSCDKVVLDCDNDQIVAWTKKNGILLERFGVDNKELNIKSVAGYTFEDESVDSLAALQVEKAEAESEDESPYSLAVQQAKKAEADIVNETVNEIPAVSDIAVGDYTDPDGNVYSRKKGPKLKGDLAEAIKKYGFENLTYSASD
jgi:hypothetical protein